MYTVEGICDTSIHHSTVVIGISSLFIGDLSMFFRVLRNYAMKDWLFKKGIPLLDDYDPKQAE